MSVKLKSVMFRNLLYLHEVLTCGQIRKAAGNNGIKASNLSKIIADTENLTHKKLFLRSTRGLTPTADAIKLSEEITALENRLDAIINRCLAPQHTSTVKLYTPKNLQLKNLQDYSREIKVISCNNPDEADVIISYSAPGNPENLVVVKNQLGNKIAQMIWVSAVNTPQAVKLAEKIINDLHAL